MIILDDGDGRPVWHIFLYDSFFVNVNNTKMDVLNILEKEPVTISKLLID